MITLGIDSMKLLQFARTCAEYYFNQLLFCTIIIGSIK
jgi:hypothetical protein